jgi:hypothetical protein
VAARRTAAEVLLEEGLKDKIPGDVPFELLLRPGENLARIRGFGPDEFASTNAALRSIAEDPRLKPGMPVLIDVRELDYLATPPEVSAFASPDSFPPVFIGRRVALLCRRGAQFGVARTFSAKAEPVGAQVEVFTEPDLALAWLAGGTMRPLAGLPEKR